MGKIVECEQIEMYRVSPPYGIKNLRITKVRALRRGKTVFLPIGSAKRYSFMRSVFSAPEKAIKKRLAECEKETRVEAEWDAKRREEIKALKALL